MIGDFFTITELLKYFSLFSWTYADWLMIP